MVSDLEFKIVRFVAVFNYMSVVAGYSELFASGSEQQNKQALILVGARQVDWGKVTQFGSDA